MWCKDEKGFLRIKLFYFGADLWVLAHLACQSWKRENLLLHLYMYIRLDEDLKSDQEHV